jgi:hypothetical protein
MKVKVEEIAEGVEEIDNRKERSRLSVLES